MPSELISLMATAYDKKPTAIPGELDHIAWVKLILPPDLREVEGTWRATVTQMAQMLPDQFQLLRSY